MKILVTGAKGFVGKNLVANLINIKEGKDRTRPNLHVEEIFEYDIDTDPMLLDAYCAQAGHHQGTALAPHQVGTIYRGERPRPHPTTQ